MSRPKIVIGIIFIIILAIFLVVFGILPGRRQSSPRPVTLEVWGLEDARVWEGVIDGFKKTAPHITVVYRRLPERDYEETLINRLAEGRGPDVFLLKNSWITKHRDKIAPLSQRELGFSVKNFRDEFADIAADDLIGLDGTILGLPLYVDTLALYYNKDLFNLAGIALPPQTWVEASGAARRLTRIQEPQGVLRSGLALGAGGNVEHAMEIVSAFILQRGDDAIVDRATGNTALGERSALALESYVSFGDPTKPNYSWSARLPKSLDAFAEGTAAMAIGFGEDRARVRAKNPHLNFGLAPLPQEEAASRSLTYGRYYFPTVSKLSANQAAAWQFIIFAASREGVSPYLKATDRAPARRDLIGAGPPAGGSPENEIFFRQALTAKSWPVPDEQAVRRIFEEAIESVRSRSAAPGRAVDRLREQLRALLP